MPRKHASRLRPLVAAIGMVACTLAGAGGDHAASPPALIDPAVHTTPHGDTPHDAFAAAVVGRGSLRIV